MPPIRAANQSKGTSLSQCGGGKTQSQASKIKLPVIGSDGIRHSQAGRKRAIVLLIVQSRQFREIRGRLMTEKN